MNASISLNLQATHAFTHLEENWLIEHFVQQKMGRILFINHFGVLSLSSLHDSCFPARGNPGWSELAGFHPVLRQSSAVVPQSGQASAVAK